MVVESVRVKFIKSKELLIEYLKKHEKNPTEKQWDEYAKKANCLSSRTMGFVDGGGFKKLCYNLRKEIKKSKDIKN
ncbi:MAG: hypothetical protein J6A29_01160 [Clostridia bacterium]|nr:hypothetical protein [Clostridia bacterium]